MVDKVVFKQGSYIVISYGDKRGIVKGMLSSRNNKAYYVQFLDEPSGEVSMLNKDDLKKCTGKNKEDVEVNSNIHTEYDPTVWDAFSSSNDNFVGLVKEVIERIEIIIDDILRIEGELEKLPKDSLAYKYLNKELLNLNKELYELENLEVYRG